MGSWVIDVSDADFETAVLGRSQTCPVVVDFWAPWCGPCRVLGPMLERLAQEHEGKFVLAKVNVDENPVLSSTFRIQGIPAVKVFKDGDLFTEFTGALPEPQVREILGEILPSPLDEVAAEADAMAARGEIEAARERLDRVLKESPNHPRALLIMGRLSMETDPDEAVSMFERVPLGTPERKEADHLLARCRLNSGNGEDVTVLRKRVSEHPDDLAAHFSLAKALAAAEDYEAALEEFLFVLSRDRSVGDDGARKSMIQIFEVLGLGNELADRYRSEMAKILFS